MTILSVRHVTTYRYRQPVSFGEHRIMFRPRDSYDQQLLEARLEITPEPARLRWIHDVFGNPVALASFDRRAAELRFETLIRVDHVAAEVPPFELPDRAETYPVSYGEEMADLARSMERHRPDPGGVVDAWARRFLRRDGLTRTRDLLAGVTAAIHDEIAYVARDEHGVQDPAQTLRQGSGSCRDMALLMMEAVRSLGFAARFVSGYVHSPLREVGGKGNVGGGATHAWVQVYLPEAGWIEFDPTNGILGSRDLIRVAIARDPAQAVPLSGSWTGFPSDSLGMEVAVTVTDEEAEQQAPMSLSAG